MIDVTVSEKLSEVRRLVECDELDQALARVIECEQIKPVTLATVNVKATVLQALGRTQEAEACYAGLVQLYHVGEEELEALHRLWTLAQVNHDEGWAHCARFEYCHIKQQINPDAECRMYLEEREAELRRMEQVTLRDLGSAQDLSDLGWMYWMMRQRAFATVCFAAAHLRWGRPIAATSTIGAALRGDQNLLTLSEQLLSDAYPVVVLQSGEHGDEARYGVMASVLADMGRTVYWVKARSSWEDGVDDVTPLKEPFERVEGRVHTMLSEPHLGGVFEHIYDHLPRRYAPLISSRRRIFDLMDTPALRHKVKLLADYNLSSAYFDDFSAFGYLGDYAEYIGGLYGVSIAEQIARPASTALSVIIPTRNSAVPLRYTLRTCLAQEVTDVEFLVCDNSAPGNNETRELVEEFSDHRLRYIRPPRPLNLTRNFEYAFLQARGEFLLSMGSDDGIVFGGLKTLMAVVEALPECDVIQWDRVFYVWPDSLADRSGLIQTLRPYRRGQVDVNFYNCAERMRSILKNPNHVGLLPMLYINSGMRRRYFQQLLERTGQLWDGLSQDIYISVINCFLNRSIPLVQYPLTIAGMGGNSMGVRMSQGWKKKTDAVAECAEYAQNTTGYAVPGRLERLVPVGYSDSINLYQSFLRAIQSGCNPEITRDMVDWRWAFVFMMHQDPKDSLAHDRFIKWMQWAAEQHGPEFGKWFCEEAMPHAYAPMPERTKAGGDKSYTEGFLKDGGVMLNSEKMGVTNVYEAAQLFEKLLDTGALDPQSAKKQ